MRNYTVLIVEDDPIDQMHYRKLLMQLGANAARIQQALDAEAGLAALQAGTFDCVLLDFNLPSMNGFEFLTAAAVNGELPCAVVLITGQGSEGLAVEAMKRGVQDYLVKDQINATSLWRTVTQSVSQAELRRDLAQSLRELTAANLAFEHEARSRRAVESDLRTAKSVAERANQAKTRFVAMVTHDLRTPLNGIMGYAKLLQLEGGLSARQDTQVGAMIQAGQHMLSMIEEVLDFAKIETGRVDFQPKSMSVCELIKECIAAVRPAATERGLDIRIVGTPNAPQRIVADAGRLRQVLLNLLGNAVKYTPAGSIELRVSAAITPGSLRIDIVDTGPGIDEPFRSRLFQDFERLTTSDQIEGAGLGLTIAARIIQLMGGTIGHTPNPAGGSIFWFEIPTDGSCAGVDVITTDPETIPQRRRVLLVDDIKINLDIIGSFLEAAGYIAVIADNGNEAIRLASEQRFDLILMDVRMPGTDGLDAARQIRSLSGQHARVPILALTAYASLDEIARCLDAGMDGHVPKPVKYETLIRAIDETIAHTQSRNSPGASR